MLQENSRLVQDCGPQLLKLLRTIESLTRRNSDDLSGTDDTIVPEVTGHPEGTKDIGVSAGSGNSHFTEALVISEPRSRSLPSLYHAFLLTARFRG